MTAPYQRWRPGAAAEIADKLQDRAREFLAYLFPNGTVVGDEFCIGSLDGERGKSLKVSLNGKGCCWSDFATGETGGDLLDLLAAERGCSLAEAMNEGAAWLGLDADKLRERDSRQQEQQQSAEPEPLHVAPVPPDAPPPPNRHPSLGKPHVVFTYRNAEGQTLFHIARWEASDERRKVFLPLTLWLGRDGKLGWKWKGAPAPRPLYALDRLAQHPDRGVLLVEGEKTVAAAAADLDLPNLVISTWPGGTGSVDHCDLAPLKGREIVLWADADAAGRKAMQRIAERLRAEFGIVARVVELPEGLPEGFDLADQPPPGWSQQTVEQLITEAQPIAKDSAADILARAGINWAHDALNEPLIDDAVIKGLIYRKQCSVIWGTDGCGKSFGATTMCAAVALGIHFFGHKTAECGGIALYIGAEGRTGRRLQAYILENKLEERRPFHLAYRNEPLGVLTEKDFDEITQIVTALETATGFKVLLIVLDTLSSALEGQPENKVMETAVAFVRRLAHKTEAHVCLIHHCGLDEARPRGPTVLIRNADTVIAVTRDRNGVVTWQNTKQRDGELAKPFSYKLKQITLGTDQDDSEITSCVVEPVATPEATEKRKKSSRSQTELVDADWLNCIVDALARCAEVYQVAHDGPTVKAISNEIARKRLIDTGRLDGTPKQISDKYQNWKTRQRAKGTLCASKTHVWLHTGR